MSNKTYTRVDNVRHTSGYILMVDPASKGNIVGMIRQMTTTLVWILSYRFVVKIV